MIARRRAVSALALAALLSAGLAACEDLLQEPDTGIATRFTLVVVSGSGQMAAPGTTLAAPLRVRLVDLQSHAVERLRVEWIVVRGGGSVSPRNTFTDAEGLTEASWTLGPEAGLQVVQAQLGDETATFEASTR